ncbi:MAG: site-specific integrase [Phycisphaerales bacterium]
MRTTKKPPKYCLHKPSGRARIVWKGRHIWLGKYGTPESRQRYARVIASIAAEGRVPDEYAPRDIAESVTVADLTALHRDWAAATYQDDGVPTKRYMTIDRVLTLLEGMFGDLDVHAFGPRELQAFRKTLEQRDGEGRTRNRRTINEYTQIVVAVYKWAVSEGRVGVETWQALTSVSPLRTGRTTAAERRAVMPVCIETVNKTCAMLPCTLASLVRVQLLTGMRPGEAVSMRVGDIDRDGPVWIYRPARHKNAHRGKAREIAIPLAAQPLIQKYIDASESDGIDHIFSPERAEQERERRRTRPGSLDGGYHPCAYAKAIKRAAVQAGVEHWHPHQLRHAYATAAKQEAGWEAARVLLGHSSASTTEIYVEEDRRIAMMSADRVAKRLMMRKGE